MNFLKTPSPMQKEDIEEDGEGVYEDQQQILSAWEAVDFSNFQLSLDEQANKLVELEEARINLRKDLATNTKEFKSSSSDPKADSLALVKLYQKALDDVTGQAKYGTTAFLTAFKILRELPDPYYSLSSALHKISNLQFKLKVLTEREENLANALRASREKAKGAEELRAEREQFKEFVQLDGDAKLDGERVAAQEALAIAQANFDEEVSKLQSQLNLALEEIERLKVSEMERKDQLESNESVNKRKTRADSIELEQARSEGYSNAERTFLLRLEEFQKAADKTNEKYQEQLEELRTTLSYQLEQIGDLKAELAARPSVEAFDKLKIQLSIMSKLTKTTNQENEDESESINESIQKLDGLEAWLLSTNQRLVEELNQVKEKLNEEQRKQETQTVSNINSLEGVPSLLLTTSDNTKSGEEETKASISAIKSQRDRLRAVLEKRDLEIERLQNQVDDRDQKIRRLDDDAEKLRQRVRFLQSYKVSEKSTLLPSALSPSDPEKGPALLGRGVGHEFRNLWESDQKNKPLASSSFIKSMGRGRRSILFVYILALHVWVLIVWFHSSSCSQTLLQKA